MTDVQVSNARRIGFTALALVSFWVLAWKIYSVWCDIGHGGLQLHWLGLYLSEPWGIYDSWEAQIIYAVISGSAAVLPTALLSLSRRNNVFKLRDPWTLISCMLLVVTLVLSHRQGFDDAILALDVAVSDRLTLEGIPNTEEFSEEWTWPIPSDAVAHQNHVVSWLWLLLPIILTTAFVIFGAWRSAVKAREVEADAVEEDELT